MIAAAGIAVLIGAVAIAGVRGWRPIALGPARQPAAVSASPPKTAAPGGSDASGNLNNFWTAKALAGPAPGEMGSGRRKSSAASAAAARLPTCFRPM